MLNLDRSTLDRVIAKALLDAAAHPRWIVAIGRAAVELDSNPYIERGDHGLIIGSPSGKCYAANGICQCTAFEYGQPCWHRAAARLVRLHDEAQAAQAKAEVDADQSRHLVADTIAWQAEQTARRAAYDKAVAEMEELFA